MRTLVVSNMRPDASHPERGRFVRDQVEALQMLPDVEVELFEFPPGSTQLLSAYTCLLRRRRRAPVFDVVHAHFSLSALPAFAAKARVRGLTLHGTDVHDPRTRQVTRLLLPAMDLVVAVSTPLARALPGAAARRRAEVIPCGVDLQRFQASDRRAARVSLGLDPNQPTLLFPADPQRVSKRHYLAMQLASAADVPLLTLGGISPELVPLYVNAANAVVVPSEREGFGLATLEALACDVPVLATPVGIHPDALKGVLGTLCQRFDQDVWLQALNPHLRDPDPRIEGRVHVERFSSQRMAMRQVEAWREALARSGK